MGMGAWHRAGQRARSSERGYPSQSVWGGNITCVSACARVCGERPVCGMNQNGTQSGGVCVRCRRSHHHSSKTQDPPNGVCG